MNTGIKNVKSKRAFIIAALSLALITVFLCSCGKKKKEVPEVQLSVWGSEQMIPLLKEQVEEFNKIHKDEVKLVCNFSIEGEDTCRDTILNDTAHCPDLFSFADDQFDDLYNHKVLLKIEDNPVDIIERTGGIYSNVAQIITQNGDVYAYPQTAGNGYFLYYNKKYFSDEDVLKLDTILEKCAESGKKFSMDLSSGWYLYSFFKGADFSLKINDEGKNECDWNATSGKYRGTDVAESILRMAKNEAFVSLKDDEFVEALKNGEVIAGINGPWNSNTIIEAWGDDYAAAKLPTYTLSGEQVQMGSFAGYKLLGISANTEYPEWCMKLADFLTNDENQLKRFEKLGECPVNVSAAASDDVKKNKAVAALSEQSQFSSIQRIASPYWDASGKFGITLAAGNSGNRDLQELLDEMVDEACS